ncbi:TatD family hydrolase [Clostridium grantii]|uniref:TatD DNase family protein n=1 Tax=Clostridium grantii DSM 8605 TaxID=1121316 RepID=A0A1M5VK49_9CLOT|nr:TatD family hydrolase [Clostridium grantii]SHH75652.1 TatD DNase family protein [Clostridium grantii DSM 8605]
MNNLIDTHFHLDYYRNHKEIYDGINKLKQYTLCVTNQPEIFESCMDIYQTTKYVKFALGYNPRLICETEFNKKSFLKNLNKTNYIGEVGLDFAGKYKEMKFDQINIFNFIAEQASKYNKLMSVHCSKAYEDLYNIIKANNNKKIILHWYSGNQHWGDKFLELGCYFSVNGNMLRSNKGIQLLEILPVDKILVESDGPFSTINRTKYTFDKLNQVYDNLGNLLEDSNIENTIYKNFKTLLSK